MKRLSFIVTCFLFLGFSRLSAQTMSISTDLPKQIQSSLVVDNYTRAMQNAVSNNDVKALALNREVATGIDHHFAHKIPVSTITDQKSSGRCWLFTALNVLRPKVTETYNLKEFEFSQSYLFFRDQLEKANLFLESVIATRDRDIDDREVQWLFQNPIGDGGVWSMMSRLIRRKLRARGIQIRQWHSDGKREKFIRRQKPDMLAEIYRILVISLGTPPAEFTWRYIDKNDSLIVGKTYTPQQFYTEVVGAPLDNYVMLMDDPSKEYYQLYEIEYDRNCIECPNWTFINLPVTKIKQFSKQSILADEPMYFSCDVGKQLDKEAGLLVLNLFDYEAVFGVSFDMTKKQRILSYESGSTHGMTLVGLDTSATSSVTKWLLENSWGADAGHNGYLTMTDEWFDEYMFRLVVLKEFLPPKVLKVLKQKPTLLPPWDRMF